MTDEEISKLADHEIREAIKFEFEKYTPPQYKNKLFCSAKRYEAVCNAIPKADHPPGLKIADIICDQWIPDYCAFWFDKDGVMHQILFDEPPGWDANGSPVK